MPKAYFVSKGWQISSTVSNIRQYLPPKDSIAFSVSNKRVSHAESNTAAFFASSIEHDIFFIIITR